MHTTSPRARPSRRLVLSALALAPALAGCESLIEDVFDSCPDDPADSGGIGWIPDVAHPVFFGVRDLTPADGAPRNLSIYYPAATFRAPPVLRLCIARWPVVLFLHGMPPIQGRPTSPWRRAWHRLPGIIARCGYVVVVPDHNPQLIESDPGRAVADAMADIEWVRHQWSDAEWVDKRPTSTVIAGHSYGALIAARFAAAHQVGALVSLSGPYGLDGRSRAALQAVTAPSFFMWGKGFGPPPTESEDLDEQGFWSHLTQDRYAAVFQGEHFDYVEASDAGGAPRGPCAHIGGAAGDLAALFIAANIASLTRVGVDLRKPQVQLTPQQEIYAGGHLNNLDLFGPECKMTLRWKVGGATGGRQFGMPF
jgi:pimeloyl-ACP methyl ester carboxylesterase